MRALIQRTSEASVTVDSRTVSSIGQGLLVLLGVMKGDTEKDLMYLVRKIAKLRIFYDDDDKMNLSVLDIGGEVIVVSQFTLASDTRRGNRPSFVEAESPARAQQMYEMFIEQLSAMGIKVGQGEFGAHMSVALVNDGPVTIIMDSK